MIPPVPDSSRMNRPRLIEGFYWSILLIAGVPLMILTVVGVIAWRQHHGKRQANAHAASTISAP